MTTYTRHLGQDKTEQDRSPCSARIWQDDNLHKTLRTRQDRKRHLGQNKTWKPRFSWDKARQDNLHKTLRTKQDRSPGSTRIRQDKTTCIRHLGQDKMEQDKSPGLAGIRQDKTTYTRHLGQDKTRQNQTEAQAQPGRGQTRQPT